MSTESLRDLIAELSTSATVLAVLAAELQARASGTPLPAPLQPHVDAILDAIGGRVALDGTSPDEWRPLLAELRHFWLLDTDFLAHRDRGPGWSFTDPAVLESGGEATEGFANALVRFAPGLDGLAARLQGPDARFLDVGTGVGRLSIAMARRWPSVRVVGVDTWGPSLAIARRNVAAAGLEDRIELREQSGTTVPESEAFDLAWIPAPFVSPDAIGPLLARVHGALKCGGWLLFATAKPGDDLRAAVMRFRVAQWGGRPTTLGEAETCLAGAGFVNVHALPAPPRDFKMVVAARRPPAV
jgi:SAM-dependent methyltransferase